MTQNNNQLYEELRRVFDSTDDESLDEEIIETSEYYTTDDNVSDEDYSEMRPQPKKHKKALMTSETDIPSYERVVIPDIVSISTPVVSFQFVEENRQLLVSPELLYRHLFTDAMQYLHLHTRQRYMQNQQAKMLTDENLSYFAITLDEIIAFSGAILLMDIYPLPTLEMYWGVRHSLVCLNQIANAFTYNRFKAIRQVMRCDDYDYMSQSICKQVATVICKSNIFCVDEQLRKFNGKYANKIAMERKPAGIGCNAQILADGLTKLPVWYSIKGRGSLNHVELGILF